MIVELLVIAMIGLAEGKEAILMCYNHSNSEMINNDHLKEVAVIRSLTVVNQWRHSTVPCSIAVGRRVVKKIFRFIREYFYLADT